MTFIKSRTSSKFSQIGPLTTELAVLERQKKSHTLIMGKWCFHASSFIFDRIIIKISGNQDRHKSSVEFAFGPNQNLRWAYTHFVGFDMSRLLLFLLNSRVQTVVSICQIRV